MVVLRIPASRPARIAVSATWSALEPAPTVAWRLVGWIRPGLAAGASVSWMMLDAPAKTETTNTAITRPETERNVATGVCRIRLEAMTAAALRAWRSPIRLTSCVSHGPIDHDSHEDQRESADEQR